MRVAILHNEPMNNVADEDVMLQVHCVKTALGHAGHACLPMTCSLDLGSLPKRLHEERIDVVFNLVESLGGTDRLALAAPMVLEAIGVPFTGAGAMAMHVTSDKVASKRQFRLVGVSSPACFTKADHCVEPGRFIIKARFEHASIGMDDSAVVEVNDANELRDLIVRRERDVGREMFAERFIDGREFNLSVIDGEVLPVAEIDFSTFPENKPRIVGYKAKWDDGSFEFNQTPRRFLFADTDAALVETLTQSAKDLWCRIPLDGYARIDFRVDESDGVHVLEVNPNPCLSPDAGFAAAAMEAGMSYEQLVCRLLDSAVARGGR